MVVDRLGQCAVHGELAAARAAGFMTGDPAELGAVLAGHAIGRTDARDIPVCDPTGTGAQDMAIATLAVQRAEAAGLGLVIEA